MSKVAIPATTPILLLPDAPWHADVEDRLPDRLSAFEAVAWVATRDARMVQAAHACARHWEEPGHEGWGVTIAASAYLKPDVAAFYCDKGHDDCTCCDDAAVAIGLAAVRGSVTFTGTVASDWDRASFAWGSLDLTHSVLTTELLAVFPQRGSAAPVFALPISSADRDAECKRVAALLDDEGVAVRDVRAGHVAKHWNRAKGTQLAIGSVTGFMRGKPKGRPSPD